MGFRARLPLLPDQACQGLTEWKFVFNGLDNVPQFIFATSKCTFSVAGRNGEIERGIPDRMPREVLFQKRIFVHRQNKKEVVNQFSHPTSFITSSGKVCSILDSLSVFLDPS